MKALPALLSLFFFFSSLWPALIAGQTMEEEKGETIQSPADSPPKVPPTPQLEAASKVIDLTNAFRAKEGLPEVDENADLTATAEYFAVYMAEENKYGHSADGNQPGERAKDHGYQYCILSENIAYLYRSTGFDTDELAERFVKGWLESPKHRENMVDPDVREIGLAIVKSGTTGYYFAVQMFARPKSMSIKYTIENRTKVTIRYESGDRELTLPPHYRRYHELCRPQELKLLDRKNDQQNKVQQAVEDKEEPPSVLAKLPLENGAKYIVREKSGKLAIKKE